jgi:shikimate dehydrogenase
VELEPGMNPRYAVIGHPVAHSLSPRIHAAFGRQHGIALDYLAIDAAGEGFAAALASFARAGGRGVNVTQPYKVEAAALCSALAPRAQRAGSANTLTRDGDGWRGDNTDGTGLVRDLTGRHGLDLRSRRTLLLGAGGAARGIAPALLDAGIGELVVVNRTPERADALVDAMGMPARVHSRYWEDLGSLSEFELLINATAAVRHGDMLRLPPSLVGFRSAAVDLSYGADAIGFLAWARAAGAYRAIDGLGMLVEQAAESFALWHGVRPDTDPVYNELRERDAALVSAD